PLPRPVRETSLPGVPLLARGKVREMYDLGAHLLMVASDRISAFDVISQEPIPGKGYVLTALSEFWFGFTRDSVPNHLVSADPSDFPAAVQPFRDVLDGRALLGRK